MLTMRRLQLLYALASTLWLAYYVYSFAVIPVGERSPHFIRGFFACLFIVVIPPASAGYLLLFKLAPWIARRLNPAQ